MINEIINMITPPLVGAFIGSLIVIFFKTKISTSIKESIKHEYAEKVLEIKNENTINVEKLKLNITQDNTIKIEELKHLLKVSELHANAVLTSLVEKQSKVLEILFKSLADAIDSLDKYTTSYQARSGEEMKESREIFLKNINDFSGLLTKNSIYIPKDLVKKLDKIIYEALHITFNFQQSIELNRGDEHSWDSIAKDLKEIIRPAYEEIQEHFRNLVGTNHNTNSANGTSTQSL